MNPWFMKFDNEMINKKDNDEGLSNFPTCETKKITTITLKDDEVALVMDSDSNVSIYLPHMDDEADVPEHIQFVAALAAVATTDQEVIDLIWKKFDEAVDEVN